jgi:hypothetical protein
MQESYKLFICTVYFVNVQVLNIVIFKQKTRNLIDVFTTSVTFRLAKQLFFIYLTLSFWDELFKTEHITI